MRIISHRLLATGASRHPERTVRRDGRYAPIDFPSQVVLIETSDGYWLFDTGLAPRLSQLRAGLWGRAYNTVVPHRLAPQGSAVQQLDQLGISATDVTRIIVSHFHADHIAGLRDFPNAAIIGHGDGLAEVRSKRGVAAARRALFPSLLPDDVTDRFTDVADLPSATLEWAGWQRTPAWRLTPDDSVVAVALPGHARGQIGLLLGGPNGQFHVADAAWTTRSITHNVRPSRVTKLVHDNWTTYLETLERLHLLSEEGPDLIPCHCSERAEPRIEASL